MSDDLEITVYNAAGEVVSHKFVTPNIATDAEIAEMISLIEGGMPAYLAAQLVKP